MLLSAPHLNGNEWKYIKDCLDTGWVSSAGQYVERFEQAVAAFTGAQYAVACVNGTAALHLSLLAAGVTIDEYVLVPDLTFIASVNAIVYTGARPLLIDADAQTWQWDIELLAHFLQTHTYVDDAGVCRLHKDHKRIRAMLPVHILGNMCDMDRLTALAHTYGIVMIEDASEAMGSYYKGKHAGTFGKMGCFSFNGNKIITTGGGGMIVTNDKALAMRLKHLSTQAKTDSIEYIHDECGYNYRLVNVLAAMGVAQMEQLPDFLQRKKAIDQQYKALLMGKKDFGFQAVLPEVSPNYWLMTVLTAEMPTLLARLTAQHIQARPLWRPMHLLPMFANDMFITQQKQTAFLYAHALSIPCSVGITESEIRTVAEVLLD